jgi:DNA-binding transcriptional LysR family regulator
MEEKFGARLLNRSSRRLSLTDVGRDYFERASAILSAVEAAEAAVAQQVLGPKGRLRVTATPEFGTTRVDLAVASFVGSGDRGAHARAAAPCTSPQSAPVLPRPR